MGPDRPRSRYLLILDLSDFPFGRTEAVGRSLMGRRDSQLRCLAVLRS